MRIKYQHNKTEYTVDLDKAWIWVRLEDDLGLTVDAALDKMSDGSTKIITYALWIASEVETAYNLWLKDLGLFEVVEDDPKADS